MPTIPRRSASARAVIEHLLSQCDQLYVHLDGYSDVPAWMPAAVRCFIYPTTQGPRARYSVVPDETYVFFVDDDLRHSADYVAKGLEALERVGPRSAIAYYGAWWTQETATRYRDRSYISYWDYLETDQPIVYVGSGTLALRREDLLRVDREVPDAFKFEDDVWISAALARANIRCVRPATAKAWLQARKAGSHGLWNEAVKDRFVQRDACITRALALGGWKLTL